LRAARFRRFAREPFNETRVRPSRPERAAVFQHHPAAHKNTLKPPFAKATFERETAIMRLAAFSILALINSCNISLAADSNSDAPPGACEYKQISDGSIGCDEMITEKACYARYSKTDYVVMWTAYRTCADLKNAKPQVK
jgi:hypothetical protein